MKRPISMVLLSLWLIVLLVLTLCIFPQRHPAPNLLPFRSIVRDGRLGSDEFAINIVGNLVAFVPLGLLLPYIRQCGTSLRTTIATAGLLSASIEVAQYVSGRRVGDVDDVILNAASAAIGYAIYVAIRATAARRRARGVRIESAEDVGQFGFPKLRRTAPR